MRTFSPAVIEAAAVEIEVSGPGLCLDTIETALFHHLEDEGLADHLFTEDDLLDIAHLGPMSPRLARQYRKAASKARTQQRRQSRSDKQALRAAAFAL